MVEKSNKTTTLPYKIASHLQCIRRYTLQTTIRNEMPVSANTSSLLAIDTTNGGKQRFTTDIEKLVHNAQSLLLSLVLAPAGPFRLFIFFKDPTTQVSS